MSSIFGFLLLASTGSAAAVENGGHQLIQSASQGPSLSQLVVPSPDGNSLISHFNESIPALHTYHNDYDVLCNGNQYGQILDPDIEDCMEALQIIRPSRDRIRFAERHTPERVGSVFPLPWRWMGSTLLYAFARIRQS